MFDIMGCLDGDTASSPTVTKFSNPTLTEMHTDLKLDMAHLKESVNTHFDSAASSAAVVVDTADAKVDAEKAVPDARADEAETDRKAEILQHETQVGQRLEVLVLGEHEQRISERFDSRQYLGCKNSSTFMEKICMCKKCLRSTC